MLIQSEFDIQFQLPQRTAMVALLHLHPSIEPFVRSGNDLVVEHLPADRPQEHGIRISTKEYYDSFGNRCSRFVTEPGTVRLRGVNTVEIEALPDPMNVNARQVLVEELPADVLRFLLPSRYCEVDLFVHIAHDLFAGAKPGWEQAAAIRDWVHGKVRFDYLAARPTKTAMDVYTEGEGVCRDFQHLAVTLSRCMNIPARYVTGYLGDIRWPYSGPGDFSAWYEVWQEGRWWTMDARHNQPRLGRVPMATGRDAADVAMTTSFGNAELKRFSVESNEINADGSLVPPLLNEITADAA